MAALTKDQLEAMVLANLASQLDQYVAQYTAVNAGDNPGYDAATGALDKLQRLRVILDNGIKNIDETTRLTTLYASD